MKTKSKSKEEHSNSTPTLKIFLMKIHINMTVLFLQYGKQRFLLTNQNHSNQAIQQNWSVGIYTTIPSTTTQALC